LVECDPSIRALIVNIDSDKHDIVIEELDDTHLLIDSSKVDFIKAELNRILAANTYNPMDEEENNNQ
jgi:TFIIH basal transcription factor complex TTD-A subunit